MISLVRYAGVSKKTGREYANGPGKFEKTKEGLGGMGDAVSQPFMRVECHETRRLGSDEGWAQKRDTERESNTGYTIKEGQEQ